MAFSFEAVCFDKGAVGKGSGAKGKPWKDFFQ